MQPAISPVQPESALRPGLTIALAPDTPSLTGLQSLHVELDAAGLAVDIRLIDLPHGGRGAHLRGSPSAAALLRLQGLAVQDVRRLSRVDLRFEILLQLLCGPVNFTVASVGELEAQIRMRINIVEAARETELTFSTEAASRPAGLWVEHEEFFAIAPQADLVEALVAATQPAGNAPRYAFSCYRASEYAVLTGMAVEIRQSNPALYDALQVRSRQAMIKSRAFHETFLLEYGTEVTLPQDYYIPGDRVWFRNPEPRSGDIEGYEGSWTIYIGGAHFANFWKRHLPYTLTTKSVEIYHWRHAVYVRPDGRLDVEEARVDELCAQTLKQPQRVREILQQMLRPRDLGETYADGGCLDRTREYPCSVLPGTATLNLPPVTEAGA